MLHRSATRGVNENCFKHQIIELEVTFFTCRRIVFNYNNEENKQKHQQ